MTARRSLRILAPIVFAVVLLAFAVYGWRATAEPSGPADKTFTAFGYAERIESSGERCTVEVAIYEWNNLSAGYPLAEIPRRNDRYQVHGRGDDCIALAVASVATGRHIAFEVGDWQGRWWFTRAPTEAVGCGGLAIDWRPDPE